MPPSTEVDRLFDVVVVVDWSASSTPTSGKDSIWVAVLDVTTGDRHLANHHTRCDAERALRELLGAAVGRRVLVGFDIALGYPAGLAAVLAPEIGRDAGPDWRTVWRYVSHHVRDDEQNRNNRFDVAARINEVFGDPAGGPFWGCPASRASTWLHTRRLHTFPVAVPTGQLAELRLAERRLCEAGHRPFSVWQTAYAGSVGGQALVGIPVVDRLVTDPELATRAVVWPFDTGLVRDPTAGRDDAVVFAEVWPSLVPLDAERHVVRDAAQVLGMCDHLAALDRTGDLAPLFAPTVTDRERDQVVAEEGWILGA